MSEDSQINLFKRLKKNELSEDDRDFLNSIKINTAWKKILTQELIKPYFKNIINRIKEEYKLYKIYPLGKNIFRAFDLCNVEDLKVVIIGQDPYHGIGQANGLSFSVNDGLKIPPSLLNIFKEIKNDIDKEIPKSGNLDRWAKQGVLLLNSTLTVRANTPNSHKDIGWETFTNSIINIISEKKTNIVFILWGSYAQKKKLYIDKLKHLVLSSSHPSPFSADKGFFGNKHFSKTNDYLKTHNLKEIIW